MPGVEWDHRTVLAGDLADAGQAVVISPAGKENGKSRGAYLRIVPLESGMHLGTH